MPTVEESMSFTGVFSSTKWTPLVVGYRSRPVLTGRTRRVRRRDDLHAVGPDVDHADPALADAEADGAVGHAPDPAAGVGAGQAGPRVTLDPLGQ